MLFAYYCVPTVSKPMINLELRADRGREANSLSDGSWAAITLRSRRNTEKPVLFGNLKRSLQAKKPVLEFMKRQCGNIFARR